MKKTAFVYGNFNILHPGHLRLLKFAKESSDYLIVGVNSNSIAKNDRLFDEKVRLESVQATSFVDEAFILDEDVNRYIEKCQPTFVVKGKEHEDRLNTELEILKSYGGKLLFTSGEIGFSSFYLLQNEFNQIHYSDIQHSKAYLNRHHISKSDLNVIVEKFENLRVLVIGDTILDEYITCEPIGMSQEDPTIVVTPISSKKFLGGAAIVASHAKTLGAKVFYISVVGEDKEYDYITKELSNIDVEHTLLQDVTRPTTLKQRFRASNKTLLRVNHLKQHKIALDLEEQILKIIKKKITDIDLVIFSDFSYGVLSHNLIAQIEKLALENNIFIVADSQSSSQTGDISKFKNMNIVTPTEREIRLALNDFESGLVVLSEKLKQKSNPEYIFTTLGSEGILIFNSLKGELLTDNIPALNINVKDTSGAGDSLLTCSSMAKCVGANIWQSAYLGSIAAAIQVSRIGNIPIQKEQLLKEIDFI
jgi:rfaE bifunctional protein kinase chain/domain